LLEINHIDINIYVFIFIKSIQNLFPTSVKLALFSASGSHNISFLSGFRPVFGDSAGNVKGWCSAEGVIIKSVDMGLDSALL
jgi:hypothetical protein